MTPSLQSIVPVPARAGGDLRRALGLGAEAPLRISYLPGLGDVYSTYAYWKRGAFDPRVPSIAYSTMFFQLCQGLGAEGQLITRTRGESATAADGAFRFDVIGQPKSGGPIRYRIDRFRYGLQCVQALRVFDPHIAVVASDLEWRFLPLIKAATRARLVHSIHNTLWPMGETRFDVQQRAVNAAAGLWLRSIDAAVCTSSECARQIAALRRPPAPAVVAAPQQITLPETTPPRDGAPSRLLYLGRIEIEKGVTDLLDAFETLRATRPSLHLVFAGGGGKLSLLKDEIARRGLDGAVEALGQLEADAAHRELRKADILVCPTRTTFKEGLAFVCFEAAAHGAPSVMSSVVPAQDLLEGGCAVYKADSTEALTAAVARLLDEPDYYKALADTAQARARIMVDRSWSWGSRLLEAINAAANVKAAAETAAA